MGITVRSKVKRSGIGILAVDTAKYLNGASQW
jgi:hypothetical protein